MSTEPSSDWEISESMSLMGKSLDGLEDSDVLGLSRRDLGRTAIVGINRD